MTTSPRPAGGWAMACLVVGLVTLGRLVYLAWCSPYALIEDEAHYWEWSRHLDWSYYSKGPGIALAIWTSTSILGDSAFAVRVPAVLFGASLALVVGLLARDVARDPRALVIGASMVLLVPVFQALALLETIDGPYLACWAASSWAAWRALRRDWTPGWILFGLFLGVGFLFKYTILLLVPGVALAALLQPGRARAFRGLALGLLVSAIGLVPVVVWNAQHDWVTFRHLLGHLGVAGGDVPAEQGASKPWRYDPLWTLEFIGIQIGMVGPMLLGAVYAAVVTRRTARRTDRWPDVRPLVLFALPILVFYLGVTVLTNAEGNWALGAYVTLAALAAVGVQDAMATYHARIRAWKAKPEPRPREGIFRRKPELHRQINWHVTIVIGLLSGFGMLRVDLLVRALAPLGLDIPTGRLTAAPDLAAHAQRIVADLGQETGQTPFIISQHYGRASLLAFYMDDRPVVFCSSAHMDGRRTQYDLWDVTDLGRPDLLGRPALLLGATRGQWEVAFDEVEPLGPLEGDHKKREAFIGTGYRGFP